MAITALFQLLRAKLFGSAKVLADPSREEFKAALERWTDLDLKVPGAIVLVTTEEISYEP